MIDVGPFELLAPLGRGATGDVWSARHRDLGAPAAVKLVHVTDQDLLRAEIRAVASLDHPHVVRILDHGMLPDDPAVPELWRGAAWYAMERASDGALGVGPHPWRFVRPVLAALLDALAHAHARGLLHRDLKPGNVLLHREAPDAAPRVVLADFGIAHALDPERGLPSGGTGGSGTPGYMAPEQLDADERALGPWTDLYALGALGWVLATGQRPFGRGPIPAILAAQLDGTLPPLPPGDAPPGFEALLRGLLRRRPDERFQCAADAAAALLALPGPEGPAAARVTTSAFAELETLLLPGAAAPPLPRRATAAPPAAPWCSGWARPSLPRPLDHLVHVAASRSLFGLRRPPPVAREAEREVLWRLLGHVHATGRRSAALVVGPTGAGRTHLLEWLAERASEVGAARVLRAGPGDDAALLARRWTRTIGVPDAELPAVLGDRLPASLARLALGLAGHAEGVRLTGRERHVGLARLLSSSADRPVLVALDDAHASTDLAQLARDLADAPGPILTVATADETLLPERPAEAALLDGLPGPRVRLGRWPRAASQALLRALLPLEGPLENALVEDGDGNPRWYVEVVAAGVRRGALVPGTRAFRLAEGADPAALRADAGWEARLDGLLLDLEPAARESLEVLAALGPRVDAGRWRATCALLGLRATWAALEPLVGLGLATAAPRATSGRGDLAEPIRILHPRVLDALHARAQRGGRWAQIQRACAATAPDGVDRAIHEVRGGAGAEVLDRLWTGFHAEWSTGSRARSAAILAAAADLAHRGALDAVGLSRHAAMEAVAALGGHRPRDAGPFVDRAAALADATGDPLSTAWALRCRLRLHRVSGRTDDAVAAAAACVDACLAAGDPQLAGEVRLEWGNALVSGGRPAEGAVALQEAAEQLRGHLDGWGRAHLSLGACWSALGRPADAHRAYDVAMAAFDACGSVWGRAQTVSDRATVWAREGAPVDEIRAAHRLAIELFDAIGHPSVAFPKVNLGFLELEAGRPELARPLFDEAVAIFEGRASQLPVRASRLRCLAADRDWAAVASEVETLRALLAGSPTPGHGAQRWVLETARMAGEAGEAGLEAGLRSLAAGFLP